MIPHKTEVTYLIRLLILVAAIYAVRDHPGAIAGVIGIALISCPPFWRWAKNIKELTCKFWKVERRVQAPGGDSPLPKALPGGRDPETGFLEGSESNRPSPDDPPGAPPSARTDLGPQLASRSRKAD